MKYNIPRLLGIDGKSIIDAYCRDFGSGASFDTSIGNNYVWCDSGNNLDNNDNSECTDGVSKTNRQNACSNGYGNDGNDKPGYACWDNGTAVSTTGASCGAGSRRAVENRTSSCVTGTNPSF